MPTTLRLDLAAPAALFAFAADTPPSLRAAAVAGALEVRPGAEGGTVVTCTVPLRGPGFQTS